MGVVTIFITCLSNDRKVTLISDRQDRINNVLCKNYWKLSTFIWVMRRGGILISPPEAGILPES